MARIRSKWIALSISNRWVGLVTKSHTYTKIRMIRIGMLCRAAVSVMESLDASLTTS